MRYAFTGNDRLRTRADATTGHRERRTNTAVRGLRLQKQNSVLAVR